MHFLNQWVLTILLLLPLAGAVAIVLLRRNAAVVRRIALGTTLAACAVSMLIFVPFRWRQMLNYDQGPRGSVKLSQRAPLAGGAEYHVAADGISIPFIILTTLLFALLCAAAWNDPSKSVPYFVALLILGFSTLGTFVCFDLVMFVALLALSAVAAIALARLSTEPAATVRITSIYLAISVACLIPAVFFAIRATGTFDLVRLAHHATQARVLPTWALTLIIVGFLIRMAAIPIHTWLIACASHSKFPSALVKTSLLPATGAYGLIRVALPLSPTGAASPWTAFAILGIVGFLLGGLCAMAADRLRTFVAYSTVSIMGCVLFAVGLRNPAAIDGAVMLLLGHSLVSAAMLTLANLAPPSPAADRVPMWNAFFALAFLAWLVAPVLGGQVVITLAAFSSARLNGVAGYGLAIAVILGVLINAIAAAQIVRRTFLPVAQSATETQRQNLTPIDVTLLAVLTGVAILLGLLPGFLCYTFTHPAARALLHAD